MTPCFAENLEEYLLSVQGNPDPELSKKVFEKKNLKSNAVLGQMQKKLDKYQKELKVVNVSYNTYSSYFLWRVCDRVELLDIETAKWEQSCLQFAFYSVSVAQKPFIFIQISEWNKVLRYTEELHATGLGHSISRFFCAKI